MLYSTYNSAVQDNAVLISVCTLAVYILFAIAYWKIFVKAGEAGWKALIPFYNSYILFKLTWNTNMFWAEIGCSCAYALMIWLAGATLQTWPVYIGMVFAIISMIISVVQTYNLSAAFNHGIGWTLGLIFLAPIFILLLAFGSSRYIGNRYELG